MSIVHRPSSCDAPFQVVVLDSANRVRRVIFESPHYPAALGYLSRNLPRRPGLDMVHLGRFVNWKLDPELLDSVTYAEEMTA